MPDFHASAAQTPQILEFGVSFGELATFLTISMPKWIDFIII